MALYHIADSARGRALLALHTPADARCRVWVVNPARGGERGVNAAVAEHAWQMVVDAPADGEVGVVMGCVQLRILPTCAGGGASGAVCQVPGPPASIPAPCASLVCARRARAAPLSSRCLTNRRRATRCARCSASWSHSSESGRWNGQRAGGRAGGRMWLGLQAQRKQHRQGDCLASRGRSLLGARHRLPQSRPSPPLPAGTVRWVQLCC